MKRTVSAGLTTSAAGLLVVAAVVHPRIFYPWGIPVLASLAVAAVLTWRVPSNPVSWLLMMFAWTSSVALGLGAPARTVSDPHLAGWLDSVANAVNTMGVMALAAMLLRLPDGALPSRRWRPVEWLVGLAALLGGIAAALNGGWGGDLEQAVGIPPWREATAPMGDILSGLFYALMALSMILAGTGLIVRYRRSRGEERLTLKWLAYSGGFVVAALFAVVASGDWTVELREGWEVWLVALAFASIPAAVGVAVLRYRLYDIDIVVNKTLVLALLAAFITAVYSLIVVGLGRLIGGSEGLLLPVGATAVVAVAFEPVRHIAQRWANRLVFGNRASPYQVLSDLTERLSVGESGEGLLMRMASLLGDGTGADRATVWLGTPGRMEPGAVWPPQPQPLGEPDLDHDGVFPVFHDGELVGALEVVKPRGSALSSVERDLVSDLAGSAGMVIGYQRLNDSLAQRAGQIEESRRRLVEAEDRERKRLERVLHDGPEQLILSLRVQIGLAARRAKELAAEGLVGLLESLEKETQAALDEVKALAKGIYPPVLTSDGLGAAVSALASGAPVEVIAETAGLGRYSPEVEAAVYFDISEAVTNAVKHAVPPIRVEVVERQGRLTFSVVDSGPGFHIEEANGGSGLENMADRLAAVGGRLAVRSAPGEGTRVVGEVAVSSPVPV